MWWKENLLKHQKVSKYYENGGSKKLWEIFKDCHFSRLWGSHMVVSEQALQVHTYVFVLLVEKQRLLPFPVNCTIATIFSCYQIKHCWWLFSQKMQKEVPINNKNSNEVMWGGSSFFRSSVIFLVQRQHLQQSASLGNLLAKTNSFFFLLY